MRPDALSVLFLLSLSLLPLQAELEEFRLPAPVSWRARLESEDGRAVICREGREGLRNRVQREIISDNGGEGEEGRDVELEGLAWQVLDLGSA